jgi:hypothetical protein
MPESRRHVPCICLRKDTESQSVFIRRQTINCTLSVTIALVTTAIAGCFMYPHVGVGPVIGVVPGNGVAFGWEAGGGTDGLLRANIGGSYRYVRPTLKTAEITTYDLYYSDGRAKEPSFEIVHYLSYEPGLIGGGTLGIAYSNREGIAGSYGLWGGVVALPDTRNSKYSNNPITAREGTWAPTFSFTIGWRYLAGAHEIYFAPKFVYLFYPYFD